jgi:hypothetical protein
MSLTLSLKLKSIWIRAFCPVHFNSNINVFSNQAGIAVKAAGKSESSVARTVIISQGMDNVSPIFGGKICCDDGLSRTGFTAEENDHKLQFKGSTTRKQHKRKLTQITALYKFQF